MEASLCDVIQIERGLFMRILRGLDARSVGQLAMTCKVITQAINQDLPAIMDVVGKDDGGDLAHELYMIRWRLAAGISPRGDYPTILGHARNGVAVLTRNPLSCITYSYLQCSHTLYVYWVGSCTVEWNSFTIRTVNPPTIVWARSTQVDNPPVHNSLHKNERVIWGSCPCADPCRAKQ